MRMLVLGVCGLALVWWLQRPVVPSNIEVLPPSLVREETDVTPFHAYFAHYRAARLPGVEKWDSYFVPYHRHMARFRNRPLVLLEVGVQSGGSALMWRWYFGDQLRYIGVDIDPATKQFEIEPWLSIEIGDQSNTSFWHYIKRKYPPVDIFIDDGGHTMEQQRITLREMLDHTLRLYICEDMHTSYMKKYGGGFHQSGSFVEHAKGAADWLNRWHFAADDDPLADFVQRSVSGVTFHESMVVFTMRYSRAQKPKRVRAGTIWRRGMDDTPKGGFNWHATDLRSVLDDTTSQEWSWPLY